jgi:hypothetical protein
MLNATAGLVRANAAGDHATVRSIGVGTEFQPSTLPISLLASYTHADVSNSSVDSDTFRLGLRWNLQRGTLAERNRFGPSLNNVSDLFLSN